MCVYICIISNNNPLSSFPCPPPAKPKNEKMDWIKNTQGLSAPAAEPCKPDAPRGKSGKKICCSCPETKSIRDLCIVEKGEDKCADVIEAHKVCLRGEGFKV